ncbi:hypothetical protein ACFWF9_02815 [Streptomyces roseolus]|uniref:hypothetical protein n=1 Tax=Streptomyces roseolus TaxID=67358 RepID=UPI0036464324
MALNPRLWYVPYTDTHDGVMIHPPLIPPADPDRHTALLVKWFTTTVSYVEVTALTATEALALGNAAIEKVQNPDPEQDPNAAYRAHPDQLHGLHYLPFSQAAIRLFRTDPPTHYRALEGVFQFLRGAYHHRPDKTQNFPQFIGGFNTHDLLGAYRFHWLTLTGHPHQALAPLAQVITLPHP